VQAQARDIRQLVGVLLRQGHPSHEIAVLYPLHKYGDAIEEALLQGNVPVQRYGKNSIAERCAALSLQRIMASLV
jgi:superfamily I DNA/RNA helicase